VQTIQNQILPSINLVSDVIFGTAQNVYAEEYNEA
jgi:hypothetical protein